MIWSSSNKTIATVSSSGTIKALKKGTVYIKAKSNNQTIQCKVTVKEPPKLNSNSITVYKGVPYTLKVQGTKEKVTWSIENKNIATISSSGTVKGIKPGTTYATAKVDGQILKCKVTVKYQLGSKELPYSFYNPLTFYFHDFIYPYKIQLQLLECIEGEEANEIIKNQNVSEPIVDGTNRWVIYHFNLKYLEGTYLLDASDVIPLYNIYNENSTEKLLIDSIYLEDEFYGKDIRDISLDVGEEADFYLAILLDNSVKYTTFSVRTSSPTDLYYPSETWFTTKK